MPIPVPNRMDSYLAYGWLICCLNASLVTGATEMPGNPYTRIQGLTPLSKTG